MVSTRPIRATVIALLVGLAASVAVSKPLGQGEMYWLLDRACYIGDELSVEYLLKAGADPSGPRGYAAFHHIDPIGLEPEWHLIQAAYGGHTAVVRLLLRAGADPNLGGGEGETALTVATRKGHIEVVRLLLAAKADPNHKSFEGTALEIAVRNHRDDIADLLRKKK